MFQAKLLEPCLVNQLHEPLPPSFEDIFIPKMYESFHKGSTTQMIRYFNHRSENHPQKFYSSHGMVCNTCVLHNGYGLGYQNLPHVFHMCRISAGKTNNFKDDSLNISHTKVCII